MGNMLEGVKVVDITNIIAGPLSAGIMADYGAEVIHVEKPVVGDDNRCFPIMMTDNSSLGFWANNRGKKSVVIDMKDPEGKDVLLKMIAGADVLVESFRPGVMDRLGLGYEDLCRVNPRLIYCSVSSFGHKGPYSNQAGYDVIAQAYSGFMHMTGERDGSPMKTGYLIGDCVGALTGFGCIMAALYHRERTGEGQHVDVSLARGLLYCNLTFDRISVGVDKQRSGNHDSGLMPYGLYEGNNGENIIIAVLSASLWEKFCNAAGHPEWKDAPDYCNVDARVANQDTLIPLINQWVQSYPSIDEVARVLTDAGVPNMKVNTHTDLLHDPHARECEWIVDVPAEDGLDIDTYTSRGVIAEFSKTPGDPYKKPPKLGQHNHEVLAQYGLSHEKIDELQAKWSKR